MPVVSPHALPFGPAVRNALPGKVPPGDYVRHGSVFVERSIDRAFTRAEGYLRGDRIMRHVFDDLEHSLVPSYVTGNTSDDDHYKDATRTVTWDPHSALRTSDGGRQSPALGLGHELAPPMKMRPCDTGSSQRTTVRTITKKSAASSLASKRTPPARSARERAAITAEPSTA